MREQGNIHCNNTRLFRKIRYVPDGAVGYTGTAGGFHSIVIALIQYMKTDMVAAFICLEFKKIKRRILAAKEVLTRALSFSGEHFEISQLEIYIARSCIGVFFLGKRYLTKQHQCLLY